MVSPEPHEPLSRFVDAQDAVWTSVVGELRAGSKRSHWMWFVFPQLKALGRSETARYYGLADLNEAARFLEHDLLGGRLKTCCDILLGLEGSDPNRIFGSPDDLKLRSSMTLFSRCPSADQVFTEVLQKFYDQSPDPRTLELLGLPDLRED